MRTFAVIGFGKIGQAIGAQILKAGHRVIGIDVNPELATSFERGSFAATEPGIANILNEGYARGSLGVSTRFEDVGGANTVIVSIPLLVDGAKRVLEEPFLDCFRKLAPHLRKGCLLSVETSIPIRFSRSKILPLVESAGKKHGSDFFLVHSPERIKSGTMLAQLNANPKIVGGIDHAATERGVAAYASFMDPSLIRPVASVETAEMVKLAGMVYRDVNIALANELASYCARAGIDVTEVIRHANTDGEAYLLQPGIGVGGHCTPVYPYFLIGNFASAGMDFRLARSGREINDAMSGVIVESLGLKTKATALILGLGFRPDVKEDAFSTSYLLRDRLRTAGHDAFLHDPWYSEAELASKGFAPASGIYETGAKIVFLVTRHSAYANLDWRKLRESGCEIFVDGRNVFDPDAVRAAGIRYVGIGR